MIAVLMGSAGCGASSGQSPSACGAAPPIASAGSGQTVAKHAAVQLLASATGASASASYHWQLVAVPVGSAAAISGSTDGRASFTADVAGVYVASVMVTNGCATSAPDKVVVVATNAVPVAVVGPNQTVQPGDTVSLDGTSSGDADRDPLSYQWSLVARPYGSTTGLGSTSQAKTTFVADVPGAYVATLTVSDGASASAPVATVIQVGGAGPGCSGVLPVASAGPDQTLSYRSTVYLSGTGSRSGGVAPLSYRWSLLSRPAQSQATLDASGVTANFWPDRVGVYVASLVVNDGCADSAPASVKITVPDEAPYSSIDYVSNPIPQGAPFTLGGWAVDFDGDALTYQWTLVSRPQGSSATLSSTTIARPSFTPDLEGQYVFSLVASDGTLSSTPSTVTLTAANQAPVASAGADQAVAIGAAVTLDGSASSDPNQTPLTYAWTLARPVGSSAVLADAKIAQPSFVADVAGVYAATLVVSDGVKSATAKVSVSAWPPVTRLQARVVDADYSAALDKVVLVSNDPPTLSLLDPRTPAETTVPLLDPPTSVSVSPNGLFAAVGHAGAISYVDLAKATATRVALNGSATEVALADDGYVYALSSGTYDRMQLFALSTATGVETDALATLSGPPIARLRPGAASLYVTGSSYSAIQRYDVAGHLPVLASMTSSLSYSCGGGLWMMPAGDRLLTRCGTVLRASSSPVDDLTSVGALWASSAGSRSIRHASGSATEISCVATSDVPYSYYDDRSLRRFAADTLELRETAMFPVEVVGDSRYPWYGRFVFYRSDGTERYVIMQLDSGAGQAHDFAIATY